MRSNWTSLTTWKTTDDPTGVLTGRVLIAEGDVSTASVEILLQEIGTSTTFSINNYESVINYAFQKDWQFNAGMFGLVARASYDSGSGLGAYYFAGFSVRMKQIEILKYNGSSFETLARAKLLDKYIRREYLHSMSFKCVGTESVTLELKIDGDIALTSADTSSTKLTSGYPGIYVLGGTIYADTFYVNRFTLDGTLPTPWTPTSLGDNLNVWLSTSNKTTSGTEITAWNDISGDSNNATPKAADKRPLYVSNLQNNLEGIQIRIVDLSPDKSTPLIISESSTLDMFSTGVSIFVVMKTTALSKATTQLVVKKGNSYHLGISSGKVEFYNGSSYGTDGTITFGEDELILAEIVTDKDSGSTNHGGIFVNGSLSKDLIGIGPTSDNDVNMAIGADLEANVNTGLEGSIGEIIVYKGEVTVGQRQQIEGFLCHKWAITLPSDHPYYSEAPTVGD